MNNNVFISLKNGLGDKLLDMIGFYIICKYLNYIPNVQFNKQIKTFLWGNNYYDTNLFIFNDIIITNNDISINRKVIKNNKIIKINSNLYIDSPSPSVSLCPYKVYEYIKKYIPEITFQEISNKYTEYGKNIIKPSEFITSKIPFDIENAYGVHLRKTDKVHIKNKNGLFENSEDEFDIIINKLLENIEEICMKEKLETIPFLIVSEDIEWKSKFIDIIKKNKKIKILYIDYDVNNKNFNSVLDMFCLSKCKTILQGVKYSTFSILSSILGNGKLINYSKYLDNNECLINNWNSVIEINNIKHYNIHEYIENSKNIPNIETNINEKYTNYINI